MCGGGGGDGEGEGEEGGRREGDVRNKFITFVCVFLCRDWEIMTMNSLQRLVAGWQSGLTSLPSSSTWPSSLLWPLAWQLVFLGILGFDEALYQTHIFVLFNAYEYY